MQPSERFTGLACGYSRFRPDYPEEAIDWVLSHCSLVAGHLLIDVGSGTGISSRQFARRGLSVVGIEPNEDMKRQAETQESAQTDTVQYITGRAEATGLPANYADAIVCAQSFHWFGAEAALAEFHRVLQPRGWVVLLWNERDSHDSFTADFGRIVAALPDAAAVEVPRGRAGETLAASPRFENYQRLEFPHQQELNYEALLGRAFSASYAPREPNAAARFAQALERLFFEHQRAARVVLHYVTSLYVARRRSL
jgi:SAM-dependent methyltransferase